MDLERLGRLLETLLNGTKTIDVFADDLRTFPELAIFDGKAQWRGSPSAFWSFRLLGEWLEKRARATSISEATRDIERYVTANSIPFEEVLILAGVEITTSIQLTGKIGLIPFSQLSATVWKQHIEQLFGRSWANYRPGAAVHQTVERPRIHYDQGTSTDSYWEPDFQQLDDVRLCITALGPHAPLYQGVWVQAPGWVPEIGGSARLPEPLNVGNYPRNLIRDLHGLVELHKKWIGLPEGERKRLRVALKRINSGLRRREYVDFAIDLGIAMEAVFLSDKQPQGEFGFTLRLRAARYLGTNKNERQELSKAFSHLYGLRSKAVHTGELKPSEEKISTETALSRGCEFVATAIRRVITEGKPNWSEVLYE